MIRYRYKGSGFSNTDLRGYDAPFLLDLYHSMLRIRLVEEQIESTYHEDQMKTPIHLVIGQEATSVGACAALRSADQIYSSHRTHGNYLAKGGDLNAMMSELFCKRNGCSGSRGGSMHLIDKKVGVAGSSAIVAGIIPIATGAALAAHKKSEDHIVGVFFGDAAIEEGAFWECLNFAILWKLPIVFLCENNFYSVCSPLQNRQPKGVELYQKAEAFGVDAHQVDATNVINVYETTKIAADKARMGQGPSFIEFLAYRWRGHGGAGDDSESGYRDVEEVKGWQSYCPVKGFGNELEALGILKPGQKAMRHKEIEDEIEAAFRFAVASPHPCKEDLMACVYSE